MHDILEANLTSASASLHYICHVEDLWENCMNALLMFIQFYVQRNLEERQHAETNYTFVDG